MQELHGGRERLHRRGRLNPLKMPGEYAAISQPQGPDDGRRRDVIAIAALVGAIFGKGGGRELDSSALATRPRRTRFGSRARPSGVGATSAAQNDPEAPDDRLRQALPATRRRPKAGARAARRCPTAAR